MSSIRPRMLAGAMLPCALLTALLAGLLAAGNTPSSGPPVSADWAGSSIWDDGLAEVARYEASRPIYGAPRPYEAVLLTVKEDFDATSLVKADSPYRDRPILTVLKQNAVREIATPNYDYRIMTSTFVERDDPTRAVKLTSGSHEWCGNTWKALRARNGKLTYNWSSYFDGEADGVQQIDAKPGRDMLEDQLPMTLRGTNFAEGLRFAVRLIPTMATTHAGSVRFRDATVTVQARETLEVGTGKSDAWRVEVRTGDATTTYWFAVDETHPMLRMEASSGEQMVLKSIERRAYWRF